MQLTTPREVALPLHRAKSVAAVPDISDVTLMDAMTMNTANQPTIIGCVNRTKAMTVAVIRTNPHSIAVGGPRRDWNIRSEIRPPANPPTIPNTQVNQPQCCVKNSAPGCFTSPAKMEYQFIIA